MTDWYYLPHKSILDLIFIISRSNVAIKITAGKLVHMSIYTFGDVSRVAICISVYLPSFLKTHAISGNKNCLRLFESAATTDVTKCAIIESVYKLLT